MIPGVVAGQASAFSPSDAYPSLLSVTPSSFGTNATSHPVAMPATVAAGDLLLCFFVNDGTAAPSLPTGWSAVEAGVLGGGTEARSRWFSKVADGSEGGTTVDFVTGVGEQCAAQVFRFDGATVNPTAPIDLAVATGSSTAPDAPSLLASWGLNDTTWLTGYAADDDDAVSAYPTSFTEQNFTASGTGTESCSIATALLETRQSSVNPGAFTISASEEWAAYTIAICPAAVTFEPPAVLSITPTAFAASATSHVADVPAVDAGDRLIAVLVTDGNATVTTPAGWTSLGTVANGTSVRLSAYYLDAAAPAGATTVDFVTSAAEDGAAHVYRVEAGSFDPATAPELTTKTATATTAFPSALTPTWGEADTLWINVYGRDATNDSTSPSYWVVNGYKSSTVTNGSSVKLGSAHRSLRAASGSVEGWAFSTSIAYAALQIAVKPA